LRRLILGQVQVWDSRPRDQSHYPGQV